MKKGIIRGLQEPHWLKPHANDPLEVCIIPAQISVLSNIFEGDAMTRQVCTDVFVNFRGYFEDDGETPISNTLENRMELYGWNEVRIRIATECRKIHDELVSGEGRDGSGSPVGPSLS
jgi:hypothetical protein